MITPLPTVEIACSVLEQEEAQRSLLNLPPSPNLMAMFSKYQTDKPVLCTVCGKKGHPPDRCWNVIGYPKWNSIPQNPQPRPTFTPKPRFQTTPNQKWSAPARQNFSRNKMAANVTQPNLPTPTPGLLFTPQQLDQLAKLVPQFQNSQVKDSDTDEEIDYHFSGMLSLSHTNGHSCDWIVDSGASDHMTPHLSTMIHSTVANSSQQINLPTGATAVISHTGTVVFPSGLTLNKVLCVPSFKHNLLSVQRLITDNNCEVQFYSTHCTIVDKITKKLKGVGLAKHGIYYLNTNSDLPSVVCNSTSTSTTGNTPTPLSLWHHRLGHASLVKLIHIPCVKKYTTDKS